MAKKQKRGEKVKEGVLAQKVRNWAHFVRFIFEKVNLFCEEDGETVERYIWRGHRCSRWKLESAFDRERGKSQARSDVLGRHRRSVAFAVRGRLRAFDLSVRELKDLIRRETLSENHLWALGQHYGLATPLLDWSTSPFVAAYFAFEEASQLEDVDWDDKCFDKDWRTIKKELERAGGRRSLPYPDRAIIGLDFRQVCKHTDLKHFSPMSSEHPRLINQRGLFTLAEEGVDIETILHDSPNRDDGCPWLVKIHIPNGQREDFLRKLNLMNINRASLFPDISGAARYCNLGLEFPGYATDPGAAEY